MSRKLISKLRCDAVLFEKCEGKYIGKEREKVSKRWQFDLILLRYLQKCEKKVVSKI